LSLPLPEKAVTPFGAIGCFRTEASMRRGAYQYNYSKLTHQHCKKFCNARSYKYAQLEYTRCFCTDNAPRMDRIDFRRCYYSKCRGNGAQPCGQNSRYSIVFSTGITDEIIRKRVANRKAAYLGCFLDRHQRDLPKKTPNYNYLIIDMCRARCKKLNYNLAGIQQRYQCWCGDEKNRWGKRPDRECSYKCNSKATQMCGGSWRNSIYRTGLNKPAPPTPKGYLGCFVDKGRRALYGVGRVMSSNRNNVRMCQAACKRRGFVYAGMQNGSQCFCGNKLGYQKRTDRECNRKCPGRSKFKCGGSWRNSIWATGNSQDDYNDLQKDLKSNYVGCFYSPVNNRANSMNGIKYLTRAGSQNHDLLHIGGCVAHCKKRGFVYAGMSNGYYCECGMAYGHWGGRRKERMCRTVCRGDRNQKCGGSNHQSVYKTGIKGKDFKMQQIAKFRKQFYKGCYRDSGRRDLPAFTYNRNHNIDPLSVQRCQSICKKRNYRFAGVQNGYQCYCGNSFGRYGKYPEEKCYRRHCYGSWHEECGGSYANSIYATGLDKEKVQAEDKKLANAYQGCFQDRAPKRFAAHQLKSHFMHPRMCVEFCAKRFAQYAGISYAYQCWCGSTPRLIKGVNRYYKKLPENYCNYKCRGDSTKKCGGPNRLSVWKTDVSPEDDGTLGLLDALRTKQYKGCYKDSAGRDMQGLGPRRYMPHHPYQGWRLNIEQCTKDCAMRNFRFAGLQYGHRCYCGDRYGRYGKAPTNWDCRTKAYGSLSQIGGGSNRQSIFATGLTTALQGQRRATLRANYMGCYKSHPTNQYGNLRGTVFTGLYGMHIEQCVRRCTAEGYGYAGLANRRCYCDDWYKNYGFTQKQPDAKCNTQCYYQSNMKCGARMYVSVYRTAVSGGKKLVSKNAKGLGLLTLDLPENDKSPYGSMGCYRMTYRSWQSNKKYYANYRMTHAWCKNKCKAVGQKYANVQDYACMCGNNEPEFGRADWRSCWMNRCRGNRNAPCGTIQKFAIWWKL